MKQRNGITKHHLVPRERSKKKTVRENQSDLHFQTVLKLWADKHSAWHFLFKNMTLDEIIECLQRIRRIKVRER